MNPIAKGLDWIGDLCKRAAGGSPERRERRDRHGRDGWDLAGVRVDQRALFSLAVARRCIEAIAGDLAAMPLELVQVTDKDEEIPAEDHRAYSLFKWSPDGGETTPIRFREALVANTLAYGNGYAEITDEGRAIGLWIVGPASVQPLHDQAGVLHYRVDGARYEKEEVVHVAGLGYDGLRGYNPCRLHDRTLGLSIVAEEFPSAFLRNGAFPGGFIESPFEMGEEEFVKWRDAFVKRHADGVGKAGRVGFLGPGFKFNKTTVDPQSAQLMELRLHQILEVCRIFGVPPHRVMQYENMHYSTVEAVKAEFAQTTLLPWSRRVEESLNLRLLSREDVVKRKLTFRHDFTAYMRADAATRALMYRSLWQTDSITSNEPRVQEGYRRREGGDVTRSEIEAKLKQGRGAQEQAA